MKPKDQKYQEAIDRNMACTRAAVTKAVRFSEYLDSVSRMHASDLAKHIGIRAKDIEGADEDSTKLFKQLHELISLARNKIKSFEKDEKK